MRHFASFLLMSAISLWTAGSAIPLWTAGSAFLLLAACSGDDDACETFTITVNVTDPSGNAVTDGAVVDLNNVDCADKGGGTFECPTDADQDRYQVTAFHPMFSSVGEFAVLPEDPCADGFTMTMQLDAMMGA